MSADEALHKLLDGNGRFAKGQTASPQRSPEIFEDAQKPVSRCCHRQRGGGDQPPRPQASDQQRTFASRGERIPAWRRKSCLMSVGATSLSMRAASKVATGAGVTVTAALNAALSDPEARRAVTRESPNQGRGNCRIGGRWWRGGKPFIYDLNSQLRASIGWLFFVRDSPFQKSPAGFHCGSLGRR
jgi:hypothetical protein